MKFAKVFSLYHTRSSLTWFDYVHVQYYLFLFLQGQLPRKELLLKYELLQFAQVAQAVRCVCVWVWVGVGVGLCVGLCVGVCVSVGKLISAGQQVGGVAYVYVIAQRAKLPRLRPCSSKAVHPTKEFELCL